jgi:hypothetical protein
MADRRGATTGLYYTDSRVEYSPPRRIGRWTIEATCPVCGGILEHHADGRPSRIEASAVARCGACRRVFKASVTLSDVTAEVGSRPAHRPGCVCGACKKRKAA